MKYPTISGILVACIALTIYSPVSAQSQQSPASPIGIGRPGGGVRGGINQFQRGFQGQQQGLGSRIGQGLQRGGIGQGGRLGQGQQGGIGGRLGQGGIGQNLPGARGGAQAGGMGGGIQTKGTADAPVRAVTSGGESGVRTIGGTSTFEPVKLRDIVYSPIPESPDYEPISILGPMVVTQFLDSIQIATGWNIIATIEAQGLQLPFFQINDLAPHDAMEILKFAEVYFNYDEDTKFLYVMTKDEHLEREYGAIEETQYTVEFDSLADVEEVITSLKSSKGRLIVDTRTSTIYVYDTQDNIDYMDQAVKAFDVPREARVYEPVHVNADALLETIETLVSEQGDIQLDPRTNRIMVLDHPDRLDRIGNFVELMDRELDTRSWILNYAYVEDIAEQIELVLPEEMGLIIVNEDVHQITVAAVPHRLNQIDKLIKQWDFPRQQVQIDAYLLTASRNVIRDFGIDWSYFGEVGNQLVSFQTGNTAPTFGAPPVAGQNIGIGQLPTIRPLTDRYGNTITDFRGNDLFREFGGSDVATVIDYLETRGDVTIISHPFVTVQDGQEAIFENITQVPFSQSTADRPISGTDAQGNFNTQFRSISRIDFIDVGTTLRVLPRISADGNILLDIGAEDSSFVSVTITGGGQENDVPQKTKNSTETQVMVRNRETIVIGGLRASNFSDNIDKIPFLGDLPVFGRLFRSTRKDHQHRELLIFITPNIVDTSTSPEAAVLARYDEELSKTMRYDEESDIKRLKRDFGGEDYEIMISIGQSGDIFADGKIQTLEQLVVLLEEVERPLSSTVVIREHPRAPNEIRLRVAEIAFDADMDVKIDERVSPFVPSTKSVKE